MSPMEFESYQRATWPLNWNFEQSRITNMKVKAVRESKLTFSGDFTKYREFREFVRANLHQNVGLTVSQKTMLLNEFCSSEVRALCGITTTSNMAQFSEMLRKLDEFFNKNKLTAYREQLDLLNVFDVFNPDPVILQKVIDLLNQAEREFQNQDISSLVDDVLHKLGGLATYYINQYPTENSRGLASLNRFLAPQYNHYRSKKSAHPALKHRNIPRGPLPAKAFNNVSETPPNGSHTLSSHETSGGQVKAEIPDHQLSGEAEGYYVLYNNNQDPKPSFEWRDHYPLCPVCQGKHFLNKCKQFVFKLTHEEKMKVVHDNTRCYRCFSPAHQASACRRRDPCQTCFSKKHHTHLHDWSKEPETQLLASVEMAYKQVEDRDYVQKLALRINTISFGVGYIGNPQTGNKIKVNLIKDSCGNHSTCHLGVARLLELQGGVKFTKSVVGVHGMEWNTPAEMHMVTFMSEDGRTQQTWPLTFADKPLGDLKFVD